jgi:hypothetical protein
MTIPSILWGSQEVFNSPGISRWRDRLLSTTNNKGKDYYRGESNGEESKRKEPKATGAEKGGETAQGIKRALDQSTPSAFETYTIFDDPVLERSMSKHRIYTTSFASVYPHYVAKAERKGRTKDEVDQIICWLTGYDKKGLQKQIANETDFETFLAQAPQMNKARSLIKGVVCGVRVEEVEDPVMREIRYLDKLIDELAKGKLMEKILRA